MLLLAGCSTTTAGQAAISKEMAYDDGADVSLINTGPYATTPGRPLAAAGSATFGAHMLCVFSVYPETISDAQQRISAQCRILAGR